MDDPPSDKTTPPRDAYEADREATLRNRDTLAANRNLLTWYEKLYEHQFAPLGDVSNLRVLEIGSGVSPLARFHPNVITSDVLDLDYLDHVFDCHDIADVDAIPDGSLDAITLTNVLHHLGSPVGFLRSAAAKLKPGRGQVIATEPFLSRLSTFLYRHIHHEPVEMDIPEPKLSDIHGPLSTANSALPWLIFRGNRGWDASLQEVYEIAPPEYFTSLSYMATGGISRRLPIPGFLYRPLLASDLAISRLLPKLTASFFTIRMTRRK